VDAAFLHKVLRQRVWLQSHALACNLANSLRTLATPKDIETRTLTSLGERLIKVGACLVRHVRYAIFQMAEAALPQEVCACLLGFVNTLGGPTTSAVCS
jgi:hypothetical protein